jgi:hypothetical protein
MVIAQPIVVMMKAMVESTFPQGILLNIETSNPNLVKHIINFNAKFYSEINCIFNRR